MGEMPYAGRDQTPDRRPTDVKRAGSGRVRRSWVKPLVWIGAPLGGGILLGLWIIIGNDLIYSPESAGVPLGEYDDGEVKRAWADAAIDRLLGDALIQMLVIFGLLIVLALLFYALAAKMKIARKVAIGLMTVAVGMVVTVMLYAGLALLPLG